MGIVSTLKKTVLAIILPLACVAAYTLAARHYGAGSPPAMAAPQLQADLVVVSKAQRSMRLLRNGLPIRDYKVALGASPIGHKQREGDERTPEGRYAIDWRNPRSSAYLSLHISYPAPADVARATAAAEKPGGNIMIHGMIDGWGFLGAWHVLWDWTDGCLAVTNEEMREIWSLVPNGTPIQIDG
jgi:murein L,D-transpeptidase YafK